MAEDTISRAFSRTGTVASLVQLPGFSDVAASMDASPYRREQKNTEDDRSHLLFSSVPLLSSSVGVPAHTLPQQEGQRNKCLFELARYVKGTNKDATREERRVIVKRWHELALPVIGTKEFAVTWADFERGWEQVKYPFGQTLQPILDGIDHSAPLPEGIVALGYSEKEALAAIRQLAPDVGVSDGIRAALKLLSRV